MEMAIMQQPSSQRRVYTVKEIAEILGISKNAAYDGNVDGEVRGFNCPNCGAPLPIVGSKTCHYCGTGIKSSAGLGWILTDVAMD